MSYGEIISGGNVADWRLNGNVNDSGPGGNNFASSSLTYEKGKFNQCGKFNGSSNHCTISSNLGIGHLGPVTFSMWVRPDIYPANGAYINAMVMYDHINHITYILRYERNDSKGGYRVYAGCLQGGNVWVYSVFTGIPMSLTEWSHWAYVVDSTTIELFWNGQSAGQTAVSGTTIYTSNTQTLIGSYRNWNNTSRTGYWDGEIDEVIVSKSCWTAGDVRKYYSLGRGSLLMPQVI